ncbi:MULTISPECIES: MFS transporter [Thermomonosporaceae]|uniref:MFS transporter n=1 Tax=Thermomonosporaceae TaxID=2012 RepID=UPI00255AA2C6|nr:MULTISPECIES: MFS transporter [Thermomonosporaceae]MDL4777388.1 MFS transporter [Actinomadura xylanilytica]
MTPGAPDPVSGATGARKTPALNVALPSIGADLGIGPAGPTSSLAAGCAPALPVLLAARFGQGAGEALASPAAMLLIVLLFTDPGERAGALGLWGAISGLGLVGGVLLSGALTELLHWRWIFFVNLPATLVVLAVVPRLVPADGPRGAVPTRGPGRATARPGALSRWARCR